MLPLFLPTSDCVSLSFLFSSGPFPFELLSGHTLSSNGSSLPVLLLCALGDFLVCSHLRHVGHVAPDSPEESQR